MTCEHINMGAYNLHIINTNTFKTVTIEVNFRRQVAKDEITKRALLKNVLLNSTKRYPTERELIIESENLYDLKLISSSARMGNYTNLSFKMRFLNEKFSQEKMNKQSIEFLMDILFNPNIQNDAFDKNVVDKCKEKLEKSIKTLKDNKVKYTISKLLETIEDKPYSYNSFGYLEDLEKIDEKNLYNYYKDMLNNDLIDIFVVGDIDKTQIKDILKEHFQTRTFHKPKTDILVKELEISKKVNHYTEEDEVNQSQLTLLCTLNGLSDFERKYTIRVYNEILGGSSNSILFDTVREKNSYAYYVNSDQKSYDNILLIYSGIEPGNSEEVTKLIKKSLTDIEKGKISEEQINNAKETIISGIKATLDSPNGIINTYYAMILVNSDDVETRIENIKKVTKEDVIKLASKIHLHTTYLLEGVKDEDN